MNEVPKNEGTSKLVGADGHTPLRKPKQITRGSWTVSDPDESYARQYPPEDRECAMFWRDFSKDKQLTMRERNIAKLAWFIAWGLANTEKGEPHEGEDQGVGVSDDRPVSEESP